MPIPPDTLSQIELLIFDLDGTLIDSEKDLALSVNATLAQMGRAGLSQDRIASYVGQGVTVLVQRALGEGAGKEEVERGAAIFLNVYQEHMLDHTRTYPGVREALDALRNRKLAVLTNKPVNFTRAILAGLGLDRYFFQVYGGNSFETKKPDPVGVVRLMTEAGAPASKTLMIGDSATDVLTGRNSGVWTCGVSYGLGGPSLAEEPPDLLVNDLRELPAMLNDARD
jgi:phosphoglycolate phosphatase